MVRASVRLYRYLYNMTTPHKRVLVHVKTQCDPTSSPAHFTQSILDVFKCSGDVTDVYANMWEGDKLLVSNTPLPAGNKPVKIKRPSFCPIHHMTAEQIKQLPQEIYNRGVDVGAAAILESCDGKVLLIRRAAHLRTFPGIWVPPGGHAEENESLYEAALRELHEESGLCVTVDQCDSLIAASPLIALWESVYPPKLSAGLPKRHHIVAYVHAKLKPPFTSEHLQKELRLDPEEVGAAAWFDRPTAEVIAGACEETGNQSLHDLPKTFQALIVDGDRRQWTEEVSTSVLTSTHSGESDDTERVSTGTKFALAEWLKRTC